MWASVLPAQHLPTSHGIWLYSSTRTHHLVLTRSRNVSVCVCEHRGLRKLYTHTHTLVRTTRIGFFPSAARERATKNVICTYRRTTKRARLRAHYAMRHTRRMPLRGERLRIINELSCTENWRHSIEQCSAMRGIAMRMRAEDPASLFNTLYTTKHLHSVLSCCGWVLHGLMVLRSTHFWRCED